jgi:iron(III) transport system permease protein
MVSSASTAILPVASLSLLWRRLWMAKREILGAAVFLGIGFLVFYPIGTIVYFTFAPSEIANGFGAVPWYRAFSEPGLLQSVLNTVYVVVAVQCIALPIAILISWTLARTDLPYARVFEFCFWIMFFLPSMGVLTGWLLMFDPDFGIVNTWLQDIGVAKNHVFNLYSFWGIVFVHVTTYGIAVKVMLLTPAFRNIDSSIEEASFLCGADRRRTLIRIVLPLIMPAILVVVLMSIIRGFETFEIELVLGTPIKFQVFSTKLYFLMAFNPPELRAAGMLGITVLVMALPLIVWQRWISSRRSYAVIGGRGSSSLLRLGRFRWPAFIAMAMVVIFISLLPFALLLAGSFMKLFGFFDLPEVWTIEHWFVALGDITFMACLINMLKLGLGTALIGVCIYSVVAYCVVRTQSRLRGGIDIVAWLPLTIPGMILGFGYLNMTLRVPGFEMLYGTIGALILVCILVSMPLGIQFIKVSMLQMGKEIEEAGRIVGGTWLRTFWRIVVPIAAPTLAVVGIMVFASAIRSVSSIMLLSSGANRMLSVLQVELLTHGSMGPAAVVGTVIVLISLFAGVAVRLISLRFGFRSREELA